MTEETINQILQRLKELESRISALEGVAVNGTDMTDSTVATFESEVEASSKTNVSAPVATTEELPEVTIITGYFDGECLITEQGTRIEVPEEFAAKSKLIYGDQLSLRYENESMKFKITDKEQRGEVIGILTKHGDSYLIVTDTKSYKTLASAVNHFGAEEHSEVVGLVPADNLDVPFAAFARIYEGDSEKHASNNKNKEVPEPVTKNDASNDMGEDNAETLDTNRRHITDEDLR